MNLARHEKLIQDRYNANYRWVKEKKPFWNPQKIGLLAEFMTADVIKKASIESVPMKFIDNLPSLKTAQIYLPAENGVKTEDVEQPPPSNGELKKLLGAVNEYWDLYGQKREYSKEHVLSLKLKEVVGGPTELRGKKILAVVFNDGYKCRWLLN